MLGGIYSDQKCVICGENFRDDIVRPFICPNHPEQRATKFKVIFKGITRRFSDYNEAGRFLTGLRYETDQNKFDERDYKHGNPLWFKVIMEKYLDERKLNINPRTHKHYVEYFEKFHHLGEINIKEITGRMLKDAVDGYRTKEGKPLAEKTKYNIVGFLKSFFNWVMTYDEDRPIIDRMPTFPRYSNDEMEYRTITDKETQMRIINYFHEHFPVRLWFAVKLLATHPSMRPDDITRIKERDFNRDIGEFGAFVIQRPTKRKKALVVPLTEEERGILDSLARGFPDMPLFRHEKAVSHVKVGDGFGNNYVRRQWSLVCKQLGVEGVSLYPGTKHTTATELQKHFSPDVVKTYATQHNTNRAFERYFFPDVRKQLELASVAAGTGKNDEKVVSIKAGKKG